MTESGTQPTNLSIEEQFSEEQLVTWRNFPARLGDTVGTLFRDELLEEGYRLKRFGALLLAGATQALDRGRAMVFVLPTAFDKVVAYGAENGWNGYQTGATSAAVVGGIFGAWGWAVGRSFHASMNAFPETTEKVTTNHPAMVGSIRRALNGFPDHKELEEKQPIKPEEGYSVGPYQTCKTLLGKVGLAASRGFKAGLLYGTTAYVGVSKVEQHSNESNARRRRAVTAESAAVLGLTALAVSGMITHDFMGIAEQVRDTITNKRILLAASMGFIGMGAVGNHLARKKESRELSVDLDSQ